MVFRAMSGPGTSMMITVMITDDINVELAESFSLSVSSDDAAAEFSISSAECSISDNDGKLLVHVPPMHCKIEGGICRAKLRRSVIVGVHENNYTPIWTVYYH